MPKDEGYSEDKEDNAEVETTPVTPKRAEKDDKGKDDKAKEEKAEVETTPVAPKRAEDDDKEMEASMAGMTGRFSVLEVTEPVRAARAEQDEKIAEALQAEANVAEELETEKPNR